MAIKMVPGYVMPPGCDGSAEYGGFGGYGLRPYWAGPERIARTLPALSGYGAQYFPCFGADCGRYGADWSATSPVYTSTGAAGAAVVPDNYVMQSSGADARDVTNPNVGPDDSIGGGKVFLAVAALLGVAWLMSDTRAPRSMDGYSKRKRRFKRRR